MAWRCSASSNAQLVANLKHAGIINNPRVYEAMLAVDRANYARYGPYEDRPQSIGYGATISAPHMHAYALETLEEFLKPGMKALDVGSGSGYLLSCMAHMVGPEGKVVGIDHVDELVEKSRQNVKNDHADFLQRIQFEVGDGRRGFAAGAPYDCIHVGAAHRDRPSELLEQLNAPGRMFVPVERPSGNQNVIIYEKDKAGSVSERYLMGVIYVPLTSLDDQLGR